MKIQFLFFLLIPFLSSSFNSNIRNIILRKQGNICGSCKTPFSHLVPHEIHHLDHNRKNNDLNNLIALCSNCHAAHHRFNLSIQQMICNESSPNKTYIDDIINTTNLSIYNINGNNTTFMYEYKLD